MTGIRQSVMELKEYYVLQDTSVVKLNQNESPYDIPAELKKDVLNKLAKIEWNRYPPLRASKLTEAISNYTQYPDSGIIVANGSNEIIQAVFSAVCEIGDKVVVIVPGFSVYPRIARIMNLEIIEVALLENFSFDVPAIIDYSKKAKMLILSSPNNPTGTDLTIDDITEILQNIEGILVVDEAYFEFNKKTAQEYLKKFYNLIIIRTFSKAFGLAGIRLGYLLARPELAQEIQKAKLPFSVGIFQQLVGEVVMKNTKYTDAVVDEIISGREGVYSELERMSSIKPIRSSTNFILFEVMGKSAKLVYDELYKKKVLVRYFENVRLNTMLRVTIGKAHENEQFLDNLNEIVGS
jgi:histidinol-phosphate aminotransferase